MDIIDFETWSAIEGDPNDIETIKRIFNEAAEKGYAEYKTKNGLRVVNEKGEVRFLDSPIEDIMSSNNTNATRASNMYKTWKSFGKGNYEFDFDVLGRSKEEITE